MASLFAKQETPAFEVVRKLPADKNAKDKAEAEVRRYPPIVVAETPMASEEERGKSFFTLASYIGAFSKPKNVSATAVPMPEAIPMTAPVIMLSIADASATTAATDTVEGSAAGASDQSVDPNSTDMRVLQFVLPAKYSVDTAPQPTDPEVQIKQVPGRHIAALKYSGSWDKSLHREKAEILREILREAGLKPVGPYKTAFYNNPVVLPMFRHNEVWYEVKME